MIEKNGELTTDSLSDNTDEEGHVKKAAYYDEEGFEVSDEENKDKLKAPKKI